ncbi:MAG: thiolase domain-containing protein [Candidatus Micrarchaeota archaeon]|nr:thiolase domain-containing protein [Candidatus Micrarchaeota archaeon]
MRSVSIIGVGLTKFGEHWDKGFRELIVEAASKAVVDAGIEGKEIQAIYGGVMASGRLIGQEHIGALLADQLGMNPIASTRVEAACASGGVAVRSGFLAVASGAYDVVAVGGGEKMTDVSAEDVATALGGAGDQEWELFNGATFPALYALMARRHMLEYGTTEEQLAAVAVKNHSNGALNPLAQYQREITVEDVMNSGYIASPLKLLDCSPITDGAAAVILCATEKLKQLAPNGDAVEIAASAQASDSLALASRKSMSEVASTKVAANDAYRTAGVGPKDIDVAEVHDCFTIAEVMAIEALGFFPKGTGGKATEDGETELNSTISVNTSGGLKAAGHPIGATGIKQVSEIVLQLRGKADKRQVNDAQVGLAQNVGGSGATTVIHILRRRK